MVDRVVVGGATGTVTVLFTDVEGSTSLRTSQGDEAAHDVLAALEAVVRGQVAAHDGREIKSTGDGLMTAFVSARKAVVCAAGIQRALEGSEPRVRIGINAGEVLEQGGDLFGEAVNAAARIMGKAKGGEILASDVVRQLTGTVPDVAFVDRGRFRLKGFPERWRLYEVGWRDGAPAAPVVVQRAAFIGRQAERAELVALVDRAVAGHGALVLIGGEPGVGKTRLAEELRAEAERRGMRTRIGHCYEMEGAAPYLPFVEMLEAATHDIAPDLYRRVLGEDAGEIARVMPRLRQVFDDIPAPLDLPPEAERRFLLNALRAFIARAAATRPQLLVLDDVHWADESTLEVLRHVAEEVAEMPVLLVGTYRDVELDVARPLARVLEDLHRRRLAHRVSLKRFREDEVASMLRTLGAQEPPPGLVRAVYSETEGNPFFVEEVFHHLQEEGRLFDGEGRFRSGLEIGEVDVPEGVRLVIGRRLERLGDTAQKVLTSAAVVGHGFTFQLLEALGEADADTLLDAVDEAERACVIASDEGREGRMSFAHELIRQTLLSKLSLPRRQRLHLRVAEAMERLGVGQVQAADVAHHLYQAGAAADAGQTARYLRLAGERALEAAAFEDAFMHLDRACQLQPEGDRAATAELWSRLGMAQRSLGRLDDAVATWDKALGLYEAIGDAEATGALCVEVSSQLAVLGRFPQSLQVATRGLAALGDRRTPDRARLLARAGVMWSLIGSYETAEAMLDESLTMAAELGDERLLGFVLYVLGIHHFGSLRYPKAAECTKQAEELLRKVGDLWYLSEALGYGGNALVFGGHYEAGRPLAQEAVALGQRLGNARALLFGTRTLEWGCAFSASADLDQFEAFLQRDLDFQLAWGIAWTSDSYTALGTVAFWRGRWDEALAHHEQAARLEVPGALSGNAALLWVCLADLGRRNEALSLLEAKQSEFARLGQTNTRTSWTYALGALEALAVAGERDAAAELYPVAVAATELGSPCRAYDFRLVESLAGLAAACAGSWDTAEEHHRRALRQAHELPIRIAQPEARRFYAQMLLERGGPGDEERAREFLTEARATYTEIRMPRHVAMVDTMLADRP